MHNISVSSRVLTYLVLLLSIVTLGIVVCIPAQGQIIGRNLPTNPSPSLSDYFVTYSIGDTKTYKVTLATLLGLRTITCTPPLLCGGGASHTLGSDFTLSLSTSIPLIYNDYSQISVPATPPSGHKLVFLDSSTGRMSSVDSSGLVTQLDNQDSSIDVSLSAGGAGTYTRIDPGVGITTTDLGDGIVEISASSDSVVVHGAESHTGSIFPLDEGQDLGLGWIDFTSQAGSGLGNPAGGAKRRLFFDSERGELAVLPIVGSSRGLEHAAWAPGSSSSLAAHGVVIGNGASAPVTAAPGTAGWILTSNGGSADPAFQAPAAPSAHASSHQHGGGDEVATATPAANAIPKAGTGGTLNPGWLVYNEVVYKAADESVNNSATLQSDDYLARTLTGGKTYSFRVVLHIQDRSTSAIGGFKAAFGGTATIGSLVAQAELTCNSCLGYIDIERWSGLGQTVEGSADTNLALTVEGTTEISTTGTFVLTWAQSTATGLGSGVTVLKGSTMELREIP